MRKPDIRTERRTGVRVGCPGTGRRTTASSPPPSWR